MNKVCILVICMVSLLLLPLKVWRRRVRPPIVSSSSGFGTCSCGWRRRHCPYIEDDASLIFHNPALLSSVSDKQLALNFMTYMAGSTTASASFNRAVGERATWAVSGQFMNYGTMKQTLTLPDWRPATSLPRTLPWLVISYMLSDRIAGGVSLLPRWCFRSSATIRHGAWHSTSVSTIMIPNPNCPHPSLPRTSVG